MLILKYEPVININYQFFRNFAVAFRLAGLLYWNNYFFLHFRVSGIYKQDTNFKKYFKLE